MRSLASIQRQSDRGDYFTYSNPVEYDDVGENAWKLISQNLLNWKQTYTIPETFSILIDASSVNPTFAGSIITCPTNEASFGWFRLEDIEVDLSPRTNPNKNYRVNIKIARVLKGSPSIVSSDDL